MRGKTQKVQLPQLNPFYVLSTARPSVLPPFSQKVLSSALFWCTNPCFIFHLEFYLFDCQLLFLFVPFKEKHMES